MIVAREKEKSYIIRDQNMGDLMLLVTWWWKPAIFIKLFSFFCLVETASSEVVGDNDIGDCVKDELDVGRIRCTRHMTVDLFGRRFVLGLELSLDVGCCLSVLLRACYNYSFQKPLKVINN